MVSLESRRARYRSDTGPRLSIRQAAGSVLFISHFSHSSLARWSVPVLWGCHRRPEYELRNTRAGSAATDTVYFEQPQRRKYQASEVRLFSLADTVHDLVNTGSRHKYTKAFHSNTCCAWVSNNHCRVIMAPSVLWSRSVHTKITLTSSGPKLSHVLLSLSAPTPVPATSFRLLTETSSLLNRQLHF